jgi:phosphinothricin acetyltransferase
MICIRDATENDVAALADLFNALIHTTTYGYRDAPTTAEEQLVWLRERTAAGFATLVAEDDGEVIGCAHWAGFRGGNDRWSGYRHTVEHSIHVDGRHHRRGIGRVLMDALIERARAAGVHVLVAGIDSSNEPSIAFHAALGFVEVARMPEVGRKFDRWLELVLMQRILT